MNNKTVQKRPKSKPKKIFIAAAALVLLILLTTLLPPGLLVPSAIQKGAYIPIDPSIQLRQGLNQCGPYSVRAVINALSGTVVSPDIINKEMKWRLENQMTLPFGLTSVLHSYKINTRHRILLLQNKNQKIRYLKWKISRGHPLILLNMTPKGIQHYFTILGYENDNFYLYDSLQILYNNTSRITI
ncbi:MAG: hypothetical protein CSA76_00110, partial [Spirochaetales bacterium]